MAEINSTALGVRSEDPPQYLVGNEAATAWRRGAALALRMLREVEATKLEWTCYDPQHRRDAADEHAANTKRPSPALVPQDNVVVGYLLRLDDLQDPTGRARAAFCAILTDFLATTIHSGAPTMGGLEERYAEPIATSQWVIDPDRLVRS